MKSSLCPYIQFKTETKEAMAYYQTVFGGQLDMNTFGETQPDMDQEQAALIMHSQLTAENGITLMASDTAEGMEVYTGSQISISLFGDDSAVLNGYWDKLNADAKTVLVPMSKQAWGDEFGMLVDKFGVKWLVNVVQPK
jgi:PhnB protein